MERRDGDVIQGVAKGDLSQHKLFYILIRGLHLGLSLCEVS